MPVPPTVTALPNALPDAHRLIENLSGELQRAHWQIAALKKQLYGPGADRISKEAPISTEQKLMDLFPAPAEPPATHDVLIPAEEVDPAGQVKSRPARRPLPASMETVVRRIEPDAVDKVCPQCGEARCEIGCERCERVEYIPARLIREEIIRPKLACKKCPEAGIAIAPVPPAVVEKGRYGAGLIAQAVLAKYDDHLPLDRQSKQFERLGLVIPRQTLCDQVGKAAELLLGVVAEMKRELLAGGYVQVDETPVRVLDPEVKGRSAQGYLWVLGKPGDNVVFEFHPGRGREYAEKLLEGYQGILQRDGYGVYGAMAKDQPALISAGCLAHGRRKFVDAVEDEPEKANWVVTRMKRLYHIERIARRENLDPEARRRLRQEKAPPIWKELKEYLEAHAQGSLPQSPFGKAVRYALAEWDSWQTYLSDGRVEIDNNLTENAIRPVAIGRKNWIFIGHPDAGWRSAVIYSIIASCRRHGIDPWDYLKDALEGLAAATNKTVASFTPAAWAVRRRSQADQTTAA
jgi:transposase